MPKIPNVASLARRVQRTAVRKGVHGNSRAWLAVAVGGWSIRLARKVAGKREETVLRQTLKPGETLVITHTHDTYESAAPKPTA